MIYRNDDTPTELYLVRLWKRKLGDGTLGLHGKLQHIVSGEAYSFHDWPTLVDLLLAMLSPARDEYPEGSER